MALQEKPRVGHIEIKSKMCTKHQLLSGLSAREAYPLSLGGRVSSLILSRCLLLPASKQLGSHTDVPRERSQGKWIGKVLTHIVRSLCSVE